MKFKSALAISLLGFLASASAIRAGDGFAPAQQRLGNPAAPTPEPNGVDKCRFISFVAPSGGGDSALRIKLTSLHHLDPPYTGGTTVAFTAFEGQSVWVGPHSTYVEDSSATSSTFKASFTQCQPHYQNWSTVGLLHVTGSATAPSSVFHVENVSVICQGVEDSVDCQSGGINVSSQLELRTTRWGDVDLPFSPPAGSRQPDFGDIKGLVKRFREVAGLTKVRSLIGAQTAFGEFNVPTLTNDVKFANIAACADAFRGFSYPFKMGKCAGPISPPATGACTSDSECTGSNGTPHCTLRCPE